MNCNDWNLMIAMECNGYMAAMELQWTAMNCSGYMAAMNRSDW